MSDQGRIDLEPLQDLGRIAAATPRQASTSATPEEVEMVAQLDRMCRLVAEHNRLLLAGGGSQWGRIGDVLASATESCRGLERRDITDADSR